MSGLRGFSAAIKGLGDLSGAVAPDKIVASDAPALVRTPWGMQTPEDAEALFAAAKERAEARAAEHEASRTDPDYWVRKAEAAISWGQPEKVGAYLAIARYYRDGEAAS